MKQTYRNGESMGVIMVAIVILLAAWAAMHIFGWWLVPITIIIALLSVGNATNESRESKYWYDE